ncbi:hypothetical protein CGLO_11309 [Colletotrichum gloeosporioides Cg-14]|uniref:Uncharacterized protein n=1 Tax=Colletotrichum gloeosporioides (strain Cg-14) TaxID=1237896 RepID=T0LC69_COLGC|nr:hypothetical protein CGLO_11309 [Colletotrichum gloeosporioides Cg-14]
MDRDPPPYL